MSTFNTTATPGDGATLQASEFVALLKNLIPQPDLITDRADIPAVADDDLLLIVDVSTGNLRKVQKVALAPALPESTANVVKETLTMVDHGFAIGDVVRKTTTASEYIKAKADTLANTVGILGVVCAVANSNTFTVVYQGKITGLSGLTEGAVYYLSAGTAGATTSTAPAFALPIFKAVSTTAAVVEIGVVDAGTALQKANNLSDVANVATVRQNLGVDKRTAVADAAYTILPTDRVVSLTSITAARTWTLPAANAVNAGFALSVVDESGNLNASNTLTIQRAGTDTLSGATSMTFNSPYQTVTFYSDGVSKWTTTPQTSVGVPAGVTVDFAGATAPTGWLMCYGQNVSRTTYAALFTAIGTTHGTGDGSTTFTLPDCRGRTTVGKDNMGGSAAGRMTSGGSGLDGTVLGGVGGAEVHTLTIPQMPNHGHDLTNLTNGTGGSNVPTFTVKSNTASTAPGAAAPTGGGGSHNNVQPSLVMNKIIKY